MVEFGGDDAWKTGLLLTKKSQDDTTIGDEL